MRRCSSRAGAPPAWPILVTSPSSSFRPCKPSVRISGHCSTTHSKPVDDAYLDRRRTILLDTLKTARPDILVTELFPFGRRVLAREFMALLDAARAMNPRPLVLCSIRDILVASSKPERIAEAHERMLGHYDAVLVHGDPELVPLDDFMAAGRTDQAAHPLYRLCGRERGSNSREHKTWDRGLGRFERREPSALPSCPCARPIGSTTDAGTFSSAGACPKPIFRRSGRALRPMLPSSGHALISAPCSRKRSFPSASPATTPSSICCAAACRRSSSPSRPVTRRSSGCAPNA